MTLSARLGLATLLLAVFAPPAPAQEGGRTKARLLYSFEDPAEAAKLGKFAEGATLTVVQDNGVTHGKNCARLVVPKGAEYGSFRFDAEAIRGWGDFDYLAIDVTAEDDHPYSLVVELWDARSKNYATRCTFEDVKTRPGRQTLLYPINRARRNGKEGRAWEELEPADKIDRDNLTQVKVFLVPRKDRDAVLWLDNIRLLQEDAAKPKLVVPLPAGAKAFKFASAGVKMDGFQTVAPATAFAATPGYGFDAVKDLTHGGEGWPDLLAGTFVRAPEGHAFTFRARVPDGDYHVWLCAGPVLPAQVNDRHFLLKVNDTVVVDETPTAEEYYSEKWLYRFLGTTYSEKPHALWDHYLDRMYPVRIVRVTVKGGEFTLTAANHFLSAVVLLPASPSAEKDMRQFADRARELRVAAFERNLRPPTQPKPKAQPGDGAYLVYEPEFGKPIRPWTGPTAEERQRSRLRAAAAPGQRVTVRLAVVPFRDLGRCTLHVADLDGPAKLAAKQITVQQLRYRYDGDTLDEMALFPSPTVDIEAGVTQGMYLTFDVPAGATAGVYKGTWQFQPEHGDAVAVPVELEIYPFQLEAVLPLSLGMYYNPRHEAGLPEATERRLLREQLQWMRRVGFTAVPVGGGTVTGLGKGDAVTMRFDPSLYDLAREVGMARHPKQYLMGNALGVGRAIGRRLPGSGGPATDRNPGLELKQPEFRGYFLNAMRQQKAFLDRTGLPVAVEIVDEPREVPNPWNRNLADTLAYAGLLHEAGLTTFVTPMSDTNGGKDYTVLADHSDILSVHAWKASEGLIQRTRKNRKTLWLYNTGMDRFSWGFYCRRAGAEGRWEWHFCWPDDAATGGYPGREWYNPFTRSHGLAPYAPAAYPGGMLSQSCFLEVEEGINDYAYLLTLAQTLEACEKAGKHADTVREARQFLDALERAIPALPGAKGLLRPEDGALVGMGIDDDARLLAPRWRETVAGFLKRLTR